jgi:hypothetical protein
MGIDARIREALQLVADVDNTFVEDGVASHSISIRQSHGHEVCVEANRAGLVHLAAVLLRLATCADAGAHYHLDEAGMADLANPPIVFSFQPAAWDRDED